MIAFIDLDGVVADFVGAVMIANGIDPDGFEWPSEHLGNWNLHEVLGISKSKMWLEAHRHEWWDNLTPYPGAVDFVTRLQEEMEQVYFLSSPSLDHHSFSGKAAFVGRHFPNVSSRNLILTPHKHLLAGVDRILIDDSDAQISSFWDASGNTILIPRPWNMDHRLYYEMSHEEIYHETIGSCLYLKGLYEIQRMYRGTSGMVA